MAYGPYQRSSNLFRSGKVYDLRKAALWTNTISCSLKGVGRCCADDE